jgi:hypothetical protein
MDGAGFGWRLGRRSVFKGHGRLLLGLGHGRRVGVGSVAGEVGARGRCGTWVRPVLARLRGWGSRCRGSSAGRLGGVEAARGEGSWRGRGKRGRGAARGHALAARAGWPGHAGAHSALVERCEGREREEWKGERETG